LAERRGAKAVAIDTLRTLGFEFAHRILGSEFHQMSAYVVSPERLGPFDILFGSLLPSEKSHLCIRTHRIRYGGLRSVIGGASCNMG
jgi:hypothetical protein